MPYKDPEDPGITLGKETGESGVTRSAFDDVDDYDNWNSLGAKAKDGTAAADLSNWRRQVEVSWLDPLTGLTGTLDTKLKKIVVTVTDPTGETTTLTAYRSKWGMLEQSVSADMTAVTWVGAKLQIGAGNPVCYVGTNLINHTAEAN